MAVYSQVCLSEALARDDVQAILSGKYEAPIPAVVKLQKNVYSLKVREDVYALMLLGISPKIISRMKNEYPSQQTISDWMRNPKLAEETAAIESSVIDDVYDRYIGYTDPKNYTTELDTGNGRLVPHNAAVNAVKFAADAAKWLLERRDPRRFSDASMRPTVFKFDSTQDTLMQINDVIKQASDGALSINDANRIIDMIAKKLEMSEIPKLIEMVRRHETLLTSQDAEKNNARFKINLQSSKTQ